MTPSSIARISLSRSGRFLGKYSDLRFDLGIGMTNMTDREQGVSHNSPGATPFARAATSCLQFLRFLLESVITALPLTTKAL